MDLNVASWLVIAIALMAANLPFLNEAIFGLIPLKAAKPFWLRLLEMTALYFVVGGLAYVLESRIGTAFAQNWEFYAITGCLFLVLGFPGFVFRYLRKRHG